MSNFTLKSLFTISLLLSFFSFSIADEVPDTLLQEIMKQENNASKPPKIRILFLPRKGMTKVENEYLNKIIHKIKRTGNIYLSKNNTEVSNEMYVLSLLINSDGQLLSYKINNEPMKLESKNLVSSLLKESTPFDSFPIKLSTKYNQIQVTQAISFTSKNINLTR